MCEHTTKLSSIPKYLQCCIGMVLSAYCAIKGHSKPRLFIAYISLYKKVPHIILCIWRGICEDHRYFNDLQQNKIYQKHTSSIRVTFNWSHKHPLKSQKVTELLKIAIFCQQFPQHSLFLMGCQNPGTLH